MILLSKKISTCLLFLLPLSLFAQLEQVFWESNEGLANNPIEGRLEKWAKTDFYTGGAFSSNELAAGEDGKLQVVFDGGTVAWGLSQVDMDLSPLTIDHAFWAHPAGLFILESGSIVGAFGALAKNDTLAIERMGMRIIYRVNGSSYHTTILSSNQVNLHADVSIFGQGEDLDRITCDFASELGVATYSSYVDSSETYAIAVIPFGGEGQTGVHWGDKFMTQTEWDTFIFPEYGGLFPPGMSYQSIYKDSDFQKEYHSASSVSYVVSDANDSLIQGRVRAFEGFKVEVNPGIVFEQQIWKNTTGSRANVCLRNGLYSDEKAGLSFSVSDPSSVFFEIGFDAYDSTYSNCNDIVDYGLRINYGSLTLREGGIQSAVIATGLLTSDRYGLYHDGDSLRVFLNDVNVSAIGLPAGRYTEAYSIPSGGAVFMTDHQVKDSGPIRITVEDLSCGETNTGRIEVRGGSGNHTYSLNKNGNEIAFDSPPYAVFQDLSAGSYDLQVDGESYIVDVGYKVDFDVTSSANTSNVSFANPALEYGIQQIPPVGLGVLEEFLTESLGFPNQDAWVEFTIQNYDFGTYPSAGPLPVHIAGHWAELRLYDYADNVIAKVRTSNNNATGMASYIPSGDPDVVLPNNNDFYRLRLFREASGLSVLQVGAPYGGTNSSQNEITPIAGSSGSFDQLLTLRGYMQSESSSSTLVSRIVRARASFDCYKLKEQYVKLKKQIDGAFYQAIPNDNGAKVLFLFDREYQSNDMSLKYTVYDSTRTAVLSEANNVLVNPDSVDITEYGVNRLELDVGTLVAGSYVLEVENHKGEKSYLRFQR